MPCTHTHPIHNRIGKRAGVRNSHNGSSMSGLCTHICEGFGQYGALGVPTCYPCHHPPHSHCGPKPQPQLAFEIRRLQGVKLHILARLYKMDKRSREAFIQNANDNNEFPVGVTSYCKK
ncbi:hypothetical protein ACTXT7_003062 [Hymenolepis weldensis]